MAKGELCNFGEERCWYSHDPKLIERAKHKPHNQAIEDPEKVAARKKKTLCRFYRSGRCQNGDKCEFGHFDKRSNEETAADQSVENVATICLAHSCCAVAAAGLDQISDENGEEAKSSLRRFPVAEAKSDNVVIR